MLVKASSCDDDDENSEEDPSGAFKTTSEVRKYMSDFCQRTDDSDGRKHARYAIKALKLSNNQKDLETGLKDISIECQFLTHLDHSNICKMRGTAGIPLSPSFGIILDRLYQTLESKMNEWMYDAKRYKSAGCLGCLGLGEVDPAWKKRQHVDAITVAYDISCALRYMHSNDLVYRYASSHPCVFLFDLDHSQFFLLLSLSYQGSQGEATLIMIIMIFPCKQTAH